MNAVWKFPLPFGDEVVVAMPVGAEILHLDTQYRVLTLWARVDSDAPHHQRRFRIAGTGHPLGDNVGPHIGSVMLADGALVFHVFEMLS